MEEAVKKEINKEYIEAAECYEDAIKNHSSSVSPDTFINLAVLYWELTFDMFGFVIPNGIEDYSMIAGNRYQKILELGLEKYPNNVELHFWKKYFSNILGDENFSVRDCLDLIEQYGEQNYVPYFFLYLFDKEKYKKQRDELMKEVEKVATAKNFYIGAVLRGEDNRED